MKTRETRYIIEVINHKSHRYETVGDWIPGRPVIIRSSRLSDRRYEFLVCFHEIIEYELCSMRGITDREVVAFDKRFERERKKGLHSPMAEPGEDKKAPYRKEHMFATKLERIMAEEIGVDYDTYEKELMSL